MAATRSVSTSFRIAAHARSFAATARSLARRTISGSGFLGPGPGAGCAGCANAAASVCPVPGICAAGVRCWPIASAKVAPRATANSFLVATASPARPRKAWNSSAYPRARSVNARAARRCSPAARPWIAAAALTDCPVLPRSSAALTELYRRTGRRALAMRPATCPR